MRMDGSTIYIQKIHTNELGDRWYAFRADPNRNQVYSIGKETIMPGGPRIYGYVARWTDAGIRYVADPLKTEAEAEAEAKKWAKEYGIEYGGILP